MIVANFEFLVPVSWWDVAASLDSLLFAPSSINDHAVYSEDHRMVHYEENRQW